MFFLSLFLFFSFGVPCAKDGMVAVEVRLVVAVLKVAKKKTKTTKKMLMMVMGAKGWRCTMRSGRLTNHTDLRLATPTERYNNKRTKKKKEPHERSE